MPDVLMDLREALNNLRMGRVQDADDAVSAALATLAAEKAMAERAVPKAPDIETREQAVRSFMAKVSTRFGNPVELESLLKRYDEFD